MGIRIYREPYENNIPKIPTSDSIFNDMPNKLLSTNYHLI